MFYHNTNFKGGPVFRGRVNIIDIIESGDILNLSGISTKLEVSTDIQLNFLDR
jgi:hypothetical protein